MITKDKFSDYLWVLKTYLRGKVLRQQDYQPQEGFYFRIPEEQFVHISESQEAMVGRRMFLLARLWRLPPATTEQMASLVVRDMRDIAKSKDKPRYTPYINATAVVKEFFGREEVR